MMKIEFGGALSFVIDVDPIYCSWARGSRHDVVINGTAQKSRGERASILIPLPSCFFTRMQFNLFVSVTAAAK